MSMETSREEWNIRICTYVCIYLNGLRTHTLTTQTHTHRCNTHTDATHTHTPSLEVLHYTGVHLREHLQVLPLPKHYVGLPQDREASIKHTTYVMYVSMLRYSRKTENYTVCIYVHTIYCIGTYFEEIFIEGVYACSKSTHPTNPLPSLNVYHISFGGTEHTAIGNESSAEHYLQNL